MKDAFALIMFFYFLITYRLLSAFAVQTIFTAKQNGV